MKTMAQKAMMVLALALAANVASAAADSYLYWMLGDTITNPLGGDIVDYSYAKVSFGEDNYLNYYDGTESLGSQIRQTGLAGYWGMVDTANTSNTFLFELFNESGDVVGWSERSYAEMSRFIANSTSQHEAQAFTLTTVVPEPTSGLLSLFGLAALALRRRKRA